MTADAKPVSPLKTLLSALALGALLGSLLSLIRSGAILVMERAMRSPEERDLVQWQVFGNFQQEYLGHVLVGALCGLWCWLCLGRFKGAAVLAAIGAMVGFSYLMTEDFVGPDARALARLARDASKGPGLVGLVAMPLVTAILLTICLGIDRLRGAQTWGGRGAGLLLAALLLVGMPWGVGAVMTGPSPTMDTRVVVTELVLEEKNWEVRYHHPKAKPYAGIITPTPDHRTDGGELPAIIMPPPCEIEYTVTDEDGAVRLNVAAGADTSVDAKKVHNRKLKIVGPDPFKFLFEIKRNGKTVFQTSAPDHKVYEKGKYKEHRTWLRPDEEDDLTFEPGDVITLRTAVRNVENAKVKQLPPYLVGFGEVTLERSVKRERQLADEDAPSIVLIVQDTMRADRSSTYGYERDTTPALTALAERGISYTNAHSASSWTWPSTASILTGLLPDAHGVTDDSTCYLVGRNETIAEALQTRGYTTGAFTCNPLVSVRKNFSQGFETFSATARKFIKTDTVMEDMKSWMRANRGTRFFLYLHLVDPHLPYYPRQEHVERFATARPDDFPDIQEIHHKYKGIALAGGGLDEHGHPQHAEFPEGHIDYLSSMYDACVATGDYYLAEIVDYLYGLGLTDNTIVAFTSDHGESWMDHGGLTHGQSIHRELVRIPLVIAGPGISEGVVCDTPVSNRHLAQTLAGVGGAEMANIPDPLDLTRPGDIKAHPVFFATTHGTWNNRRGRQPLYGVRDGKWVLHYAPLGSDYGVPASQAPKGGQHRLYDAEVDPLEMNDVSEEHPEVANRLREMVLDNIADQLKQKGGRVDIGAGSATMDLLDGIGYNVGKIMPEDDDEEESEGEGPE